MNRPLQNNGRALRKLKWDIMEMPNIDCKALFFQSEFPGVDSI